MNTLQDLPVIGDSEYIILGGGFKEIVTAFFLAHSKKQVLLLASGTFLLDDLCDGNLCFNGDIQNAFPIMNQLFTKEVYEYHASRHDMSLLLPDRLKQRAEELCEEYGIRYLYQSRPLDQFIQNNQKYLRIGTKSGTSAIACKEVVVYDPTYKEAEKDCIYLNILDGPSLTEVENMDCKLLNGDYNMSLYPGSYQDHHCLLQLHKRGMTLPENMVQQKEKCLEVYQWLKMNRKEFANSSPGRFSRSRYAQKDYLEEYRRGKWAAEQLLFIKEVGEKEKPENKPAFVADRGMYEGMTSLKEEACAWNPELDYKDYKRIKAPRLTTDYEELYDIVVAGGGTAGATVALYAARNGLKTVLLEINQELGGTSTVGGVSAYWFGKRYQDVMEVDRRIEAVYVKYGLERKPGIWSAYDDWNPGIKSMVLEQLCREAGVTIRTSSISFATLKNQQKRKITGVIASDETGVVCYRGTYIVDATGDGDIAAFAGAKVIYGSDRDFITYWASLAQYTSPANYKNNFSSGLIVSDPWDYSRFIRVSRCRGNKIYDHGTYVSPRESRHVVGKYVINLKDIINYRTYEDGIYTCFSNYDPKGKLDADMIYAGVLPPQVSIQIPLRALLPVDEDGKGLDGIIIAGKAISCTHNAFPSIRMQPDLLHQGAVIGTILAAAINSSVKPEELDKSELRKLIHQMSGDEIRLPSGQRPLEVVVEQASYKDRNHWVDLPFTKEVTTQENALRIMSANTEEIVPLLTKRFCSIKEIMESPLKCTQLQTEKKNYQLLARYLLFHGIDIGTDVIIQSILDELRNTQGLPSREASVTCVQLLPDHGVMPEIVYQLNLLGWSAYEGIIAPFELILDRLLNINRDYNDIRQGIYHYIEAFAYVSERSGQSQFIPMLIKIIDLPEFKNILQRSDDADLMTERLRILLLSLYRALARCGERAGYLGLIQLLNINSLPISASACKELQILTGENNPINPVDWYNWIKNKKQFEIKLIHDKIW